MNIISVYAAFRLAFLYELTLFFLNDTPTTEIYTLSLHDALPIFGSNYVPKSAINELEMWQQDTFDATRIDRKSTRLNSSHVAISYAVFCLKKKKTSNNTAPSTFSHQTSLRHITSLISLSTPVRKG